MRFLQLYRNVFEQIRWFLASNSFNPVYVIESVSSFDLAFVEDTFVRVSTFTLISKILDIPTTTGPESRLALIALFIS